MTLLQQLCVPPNVGVYASMRAMTINAQTGNVADALAYLTAGLKIMAVGAPATTSHPTSLSKLAGGDDDKDHKQHVPDQYRPWRPA